MKARLLRLLLVGGAGLAPLLLCFSPARANGRYPAADELVFDPSNEQHMLVRATYGFMETVDGGAHWLWTCENVVGRIGDKDPPLAIMGDGTAVVAVPFEGVAFSRDHGCSWAQAPAPLANQLAQDVTLEPSAPSSLLALTSTGDGDGGFIDFVAESKDNAATWAKLGVPLPLDLIAETIEIAPSDANRLYVSGVASDPPVGVIERSEDRGATWTRSTLPLPGAFGGVFISAIDPVNPDILYVRVASDASDTTGDPPTELRVSTDKGVTFKSLYTTTSSMLGFALSPDGSQIALGGPKDGIWIGPSSGDAFVKVADVQNRCLKWRATGIYACGKEPFDDFAVGFSSDGGKTYRSIYKRVDSCPQECPAGTPYAMVCPNVWTDPNKGVASLILATGATCDAPFARPETDVEAGVGTSDASVKDHGPIAATSSCHLAPGGARGLRGISAAAVAAIVGGWAARRRSR